jgi:hypothetical protein
MNHQHLADAETKQQKNGLLGAVTHSLVVAFLFCVVHRLACHIPIGS